MKDVNEESELDFESEIRDLKTKVKFLVNAYMAGLVIDGLSFIAILIAIFALIFE